MFPSFLRDISENTAFLEAGTALSHSARIFSGPALIGTRSSMAYAPFHSRNPRQPENATAFLIKIIKDEYETRS